MRLENSAVLSERAKRSLAGGVSSNVRSGPPSLPPLYFEAGKGSRLFDVDGNSYVDYAIGQGPAILGHAPDVLIEAVAQAMGKGLLYAGQHELEIELSEKLQELIPCADMVRYSNSGSEIVQAAFRVARAYTGRKKIVKFEGHYHGWFDNVLVSVHPPLERVGPLERPYTVPASAGQSSGAVDEMVVMPWNDLDVLSDVLAQQGDNIAAVVMEPIMCNTGCILPQEGYLEGVRELCSEHEVVFILDEIITGFRVGLGGAQAYFDVTPDLATFGKAMAGGFPVSCLAGKQELMDLIASGEVTHSGTFNSNVPAMAAALATIGELEKDDGRVYQHLRQLGNRLSGGLTELTDEQGVAAQVQGLGPMFHLAFTDGPPIRDYRSFAAYADTELYHRFTWLMLENGVRVIPRGLWYVSAAHTEEDVEFTLQAAESALRKL
jgi:glutamate-1-semialdehyde 2,1-aminomutase